MNFIEPKSLNLIPAATAVVSGEGLNLTPEEGQKEMAFDFVSLREQLASVGIKAQYRTIQSDNFVSGSAGWKLGADGTITASAGSIGGWSISATALYYDGATDDVSTGMASADYPFYAGKKYIDRATAPFRVTPAGVIYASSGVIEGTLTIGGRLATIIGGAINADGNFINNVINANLNTSAKTILGDFTFGASGAIKMITDVNNGLWISPTGILGKKAGANTFTIGIDGTATFAGTLSGASGTFGTITAGTISGVTITSSTLQTGTTGKNVDITQGRIRQRNDKIEVVYSDVGTYGGWWGFNDISGNAVFHINVEGAGEAKTIGFRGQATYSSDWVFDCKKNIIVVLGVDGAIYPNTHNSFILGGTSNKWANIHSVLTNFGDIGLENKWNLTESYKVGIEEEGIAVLNSQNELMLFIGETGLYTKDGNVKNLNLLPYSKTTLKQRSQMDNTPELRYREKNTQIIKIPDPTKSKVGGLKYIDKKIIVKKI